MNAYLLGFAIAYVCGFGMISINRYPKVIPAAEEPPITSLTSTSHRVNEAFNEYEVLMLEDEEKLQILVDHANTLSALLGAAEIVDHESESDNYNLGLDENSLRLIAIKLARLYPAEALRYYATRPTDAYMNKVIGKMILREWGHHDLAACLSFIVEESHTLPDSFSDEWIGAAEDNCPDKIKECFQSFASLSREKQKDLIAAHYSMPELLPHLLSAIKDPTVLAEAQVSVNNTNEAKAKADSEPKGKSEYEIENEKNEELVKSLLANNLEPEQVVEILRDEKSETTRSIILRALLSPREEEKDHASLWLERISRVLAIIDEVPTDPTDISLKGGYRYQKELEQWLPTQSTRLQRAWADDIVEQKPEEEALEWIEQLSTAPLRADMREVVITAWTDSDPQQTAEYLINEASSSDQESFLPDAIYTWALRDYAAATQWLDNTPDSPAKTATLQKLQQAQRRD